MAKQHASVYTLVLCFMTIHFYSFCHSITILNHFSNPNPPTLSKYRNFFKISLLTLLGTLTTPRIAAIYCVALHAKNQSLVEKSIAMREPCTIPLHCPQSSKLKISFLHILLDSILGISFSS